MTSELKPCPFCGSEIQVNEYTDGSFSVTCTSECVHIQTNSKQGLKAAVKKWNTRATPSADPLAGLVRYSVPLRYDKIMPDGEYVLHSEAAKIIEALDNRVCIAEYRFKNAINFVQPLLMRRAETAEAELAQIKAQEAGK